MQVDFAFLADAAQTAPDGKLYVLGGGLEELTFTEFPTRQPSLALIARVSLTPHECDREHSMEIDLCDQDGRRLGSKIVGKFNVSRHKREPMRSVYIQLVMNVGGVLFEHPGDYAFHIVVGDVELRTLPIYVRAPQPQELRQN